MSGCGVRVCECVSVRGGDRVTHHSDSSVLDSATLILDLRMSVIILCN